MIKVKAFVQLKSNLYDWCIMIYKFDQVSTQDESFADALKLLPLLLNVVLT